MSDVPKNIYAFTESGFSPSYISVNESRVQTKDSLFITVRGNGAGAGTGEVELTKKQALELATSIFNKYGVSANVSNSKV